MVPPTTKHSFSGAPSEIETPTNIRARCPTDLSPFYHRVAFTVDGQHHVGTTISRLFCGGGPSAVPRTVRPVVVDPVERKTSWFLAHIRKEVLETVEPTIADGDTAPPVARKSRCVGVKASAPHAAPRPVRSVTFPGAPVGSVPGGLPTASFAKELSSEASAGTSSIGFSQRMSCYDFLYSAVTSDFPLRVSFSLTRDDRKNGEAAKPLTSEINNRASQSRGYTPNRKATS